MFFRIFGIALIGFSIWGLIFTCINRKDMPNSVFALKPNSYEVIENVKFNNLMIYKSLILSILFLISGILCVCIQGIESFIPIYIGTLIQTVLGIRSKKYIRIK